MGFCQCVDLQTLFGYVDTDMLTEFATLQLSRRELKEIHSALVQKAIVEDEVMRERAVPIVEQRDLLERIEMLLGENEEILHMLDHATEDELWEYSWYTFTDEWAWFRAAQDVEKGLGAKKDLTDKVALQKLIELKYQKQFEAYVAEIDMREVTKKFKAVKSQPKTS